MKISAFTKNDGACQYYRTILPLNTVASSSDNPVKIIDPISTSEEWEFALTADIIQVNGVAEQAMVDTLKSLQKQGKKVILDYDDNIFEVSPLSPHYQDHGLCDIAHILPDGTKLETWKNGVNGFDIERNRKNIEAFKDGLGIADMVTVTTPLLAEVYKEYNDNVVALPNCIDTDIWQPLPFKEQDDIRIGWFGGFSHYEDWVLLQNVLPVIMEKHKNVKLVLMGSRFAGTLKNLPVDRIEYHKWVPTPAYPYKAAILNLDIALIPLNDNQFNRCKSPIKWVEMGSLQIPSVTSAVSPYVEVATEHNGVFVDNEDDSWIKGLNMLIEDPILRMRMGVEAQKTVHAEFDINTQFGRWIDAYKELVA